MFLAPLLRRTLARRGHTPVHIQEGRRQKISVAGALCCSPIRRHWRWFWESFPDCFVDAEGYVAFMEDLVREIHGPVILLHDQAKAHHGEAWAELLYENPQLIIEDFPAYAPELNPVEFLWKHVKAEEMANYSPQYLTQLLETLHEQLVLIARDQDRLRSCFDSSELRW